MGKETEPAKKLTLTLHLLTVETYMKKRDLKFDLAADRDRQERGGRDSRGGMRRGRQTLGTCFCGLFSAEWTLTGMSRGLTLSFSDHLVLMWKRKKEKEKRKQKKRKKETSLLSRHCQSAVISKRLMAVAQAVLPSFSSFSNLAHPSDNMKVSVRLTAVFCLLNRDRSHAWFELCNCCVTWRCSLYLRI